MVEIAARKSEGKQLNLGEFFNLGNLFVKKNIWIFIFFILWLAVIFCRLFTLGAVTHFLPLIVSREDSFSRQYISVLKSGDVNQASFCLDPEIRSHAQNDIAATRDYLGRYGDLVSIHLVKIFYTKIDDGKTDAKELSYFVDFQKGSLLIKVMLLKNEENLLIYSFNCNPLSESFEKATGFDLSGKSWFHYFFLLVAILMIGLTFFVLLECINDKTRWKWFWIPFILIGFGNVGLVWNGVSWNEAILHPKLLGLQLFNAGIVKASFFQPWTIYISLPLGAVLFYFWFRKTKRNQ